MRRLVVDTNALIFHVTDPRRLGKKARRALAGGDSGTATCHVPVIALIETWLLQDRGRLRFGPARLLEAMAGRPGWQILALDIEQAMAFGELASIRDPMDRLILASARALSCPLVSADARLDGFGVERIWD